MVQCLVLFQNLTGLLNKNVVHKAEIIQTFNGVHSIDDAISLKVYMFNLKADYTGYTLYRMSLNVQKDYRNGPL